MRASGITPAAAVLVTTVQSLRAQGEGELEAGFANLDHHIRTLRGLACPSWWPSIDFRSDTPEELEMHRNRMHRCRRCPCALVEAFTKGGEGAVDLAHKVV